MSAVVYKWRDNKHGMKEKNRFWRGILRASTRQPAAKPVAEADKPMAAGKPAATSRQRTFSYSVDASQLSSKISHTIELLGGSESDVSSRQSSLTDDEMRLERIREMQRSKKPKAKPQEKESKPKSKTSTRLTRERLEGVRGEMVSVRNGM